MIRGDVGKGVGALVEREFLKLFLLFICSDDKILLLVISLRVGYRSQKSIIGSNVGRRCSYGDNGVV